jgi:ABC-type dipeptide/oligopeptide/nickel transport system permease component
MEEKQYIEQLKDIRNLMDRSSRFVSLSGLSGVMAGIYAIIGALGVKYLIHQYAEYGKSLSGAYRPYITLESRAFLYIIFIACAVVVLSVVTAIVLSARKARKRNEKVWNASSRRMLINFSIPLLTGGIFGIMLLKQQHYGLISPITLIFYGLALVNASKYTLETLRSLGICFIVLGLINTAFPGYGLQFWTIGFGFFHILYGTVMYLKFDRK